MMQVQAPDRDVAKRPPFGPDRVGDDPHDHEGEQERDQHPERLLLAGVDDMDAVGPPEVVPEGARRVLGDHSRTLTLTRPEEIASDLAGQRGAGRAGEGLERRRAENAAQY